ncbi:MAG TPA: hypothetical protein VN151_07330, partial [Terracidiphilus sp.]|nr:hypothetical protein [Terracidiphilus sp.]
RERFGLALMCNCEIKNTSGTSYSKLHAMNKGFSRGVRVCDVRLRRMLCGFEHPKGVAGG